MTTLSTHFSKIHLLLATLSAVGLTLGSAPLIYAQDIPTPTPPADGGDFDGAPDPTPGPEATPDPVPTAAPEPGDSPELEETDADNVVPTGGGNTDIDEPATIEPGSDEVLPVGDEPTTPTEIPAETAPESPGDEPATDITTPNNDSPATNTEAPANNSPRGLW